MFGSNIEKLGFIGMVSVIISLGASPDALASERGNINDFYRGFALSEITSENMQLWPYYKYTSTHWDEYGLFGTSPVMASGKLNVAS